MIQVDLTNAYLHASVFDVVYIIILEGFDGAGQIARLRKAAYGTKQGARRFYDHTISSHSCENWPHTMPKQTLSILLHTCRRGMLLTAICR
jgi:hypothetical protein